MSKACNIFHLFHYRFAWEAIFENIFALSFTLSLNDVFTLHLHIWIDITSLRVSVKVEFLGYNSLERKKDALCDLVAFAQFKKRENTYGGVLLLVKLQTSACNFTKSNILPWVFFTSFKLNKWYQFAQSILYEAWEYILLSSISWTLILNSHLKNKQVPL